MRSFLRQKFEMAAIATIQAAYLRHEIDREEMDIASQAVVSLWRGATNELVHNPD